ncbi:endonuclease/exonuclease/phosphatase family protein [Haloterrigena sp. SYSU A121-1]|uniref:Endonuclease/exonuclease/phosphatase family protein n=1 Tax=Haloterrigena gelatinilytica TaxID=2741724 RepID=A0A8J8GH55_9EURY|nr:endonuclease/exonuclease/phosphatase family protein [Haloterrigena gelatinilytica]NUB89586.1 endonuclease/exonuclease/phosphatase family protein [Haloterrigena gelatinilytica]
MTDSADSPTFRRRTALKAGATGLGGALLGAAGASKSVRAASESYRFLWVNAWLADGLEGVAGLPFTVAAKPQYQERASELGRRLGEEGYDVVGLCEVFNDEQETVEAEYADGAGTGTAIPGPEPDGGEKGAGLLDLVAGVTVTDHATLEYDAEPSDHLTYVDAHVGKGANYVELDLGPGKVDLFTTHLVSGSLLPWTDGGDEDIPALRSRQLEELGAFVAERASPENVTLVAGDFNIAPDGAAADALESFASTAGLYDAWLDHGRGPGGTNDDAIVDGCAFDPSGAPPAYCPADDAGERIDYVFLEEPTAEHELDLRVDALERRVFWRELAPPDQFYADDNGEVPNYLADHVGLDLSLTATDA